MKLFEWHANTYPCLLNRMPVFGSPIRPPFMVFLFCDMSLHALYKIFEYHCQKLFDYSWEFAKEPGNARGALNQLNSRCLMNMGCCSRHAANIVCGFATK